MPRSPLRCLCFLLFTCLLPLHAPLYSQPLDPNAKAAVIAPFLDEQALAVAHVDLAKIDPPAAFKLLNEFIPDKDPEIEKQLAALTVKTKDFLTSLNTAGISELYAAVSLADFPKEPFFIVAPINAGGDAHRAAEVLRGLLRFEAADSRPGVALVGAKNIIERLKKLQPAVRPEFVQGFAKAGDTALQVVFSPNADTRRVLREMLPRLPDEVGGGSGKMLADGIQWAVLSIDAPPKFALALTIQSKDTDSAAALRGLAVSALALARESKDAKKIPELDAVIRLLTPKVSGDQLLITAGERDGSAKTLLGVLVPAVQSARTASGRMQSANNLHQVALAMHNYHDLHKHLPPQAVRSKDGQPLLSWRVAILPFLVAEPLYKEFHLDEPWDSDHNKKLIEKMPAVFASPNLGDARKAQGLTSYLVPLTRPLAAGAAPVAPASGGGSAPLRMVFDDPTGTPFAKITDGTSNTIMVLEANPKAAVAWTKPDDLVMDESDLLKDLRGQPNDGFATLFCDGSVRFVLTSVDPKVFRFLLLMNDGQSHEVP